MDVVISKLLSGAVILLLVNSVIWLLVNILAVIKPTFITEKVKDDKVQIPPRSDIKPRILVAKSSNAEANQRFLKRVIQHLFDEVRVLRTDLVNQKLATEQHELRLQQLHQKYEDAAHDWDIEEQKLIQAIQDLRRDNKLNERHWAADTKTRAAELKTATEIMEAAEDVIEALEEELAHEKALIGPLDYNAHQTDLIVESFNWFSGAIEELTKSFEIDADATPIKTIFNPVEFPSQENFYAYWDNQRGRDKRELENRIRSEIFVCLQKDVFRHSWFGVPQSIEVDSDDEDEDLHSIVGVYQHVEECLGIVENGFQRVASMNDGYEQEFRDWRLRTMRCLSYAPKPESPHGILEIAGRIADFFSPIPSTLSPELLREVFNLIAIKAYEFVLLVRAEKKGNYGLSFPNEGDEFDGEWMEAVDFEHLPKDFKLESERQESHENKEGWTVAFTRSPALYYHVSHLDKLVVVKAQVVVFGIPRAESSAASTMMLSPRSSLSSASIDAQPISEETVVDDVEELDLPQSPISTKHEAASSSPDTDIDSNDEEHSNDKYLQFPNLNSKTAELRRLVGKMQHDQIEIAAAGSLSAWVATKAQKVAESPAAAEGGDGSVFCI